MVAATAVAVELALEPGRDPDWRARGALEAKRAIVRHCASQPTGSASSLARKDIEGKTGELLLRDWKWRWRGGRWRWRGKWRGERGREGFWFSSDECEWLVKIGKLNPEHSAPLSCRRSIPLSLSLSLSLSMALACGSEPASQSGIQIL